MKKGFRGKPGPKSKKTKIISQHASLGESTTYSDDDSPTRTKENIFTKSPTSHARNQRILPPGRQDQQDFCTPEPDKDATDYGLEFTHSRMQELSPRRCSTFRTQEDQEVAGAKTKKKTKEHPAKIAKKQPTKSKKTETQKHKETSKSATETLQNKPHNKEVRKKKKTTKSNAA